MSLLQESAEAGCPDPPESAALHRNCTRAALLFSVCVVGGGGEAASPADQASLPAQGDPVWWDGHAHDVHLFSAHFTVSPAPGSRSWFLPQTGLSIPVTLKRTSVLSASSPGSGSQGRAVGSPRGGGHLLLPGKRSRGLTCSVPRALGATKAKAGGGGPRTQSKGGGRRVSE